MKKLLLLLAILMAFVLVSCPNAPATAVRATVERNQAQILEQSATTVEVPQVKYFQERKTIAKWAKTWDVPSIPTYVYLISFGKILGYYVCDGKPASTKSYLIPEQQKITADLGEYYGDMLVQAPDLDGTYGENNSGIRFFTAEGIAVEWAGSGASYLYSNAPIAIDVPRLYVGTAKTK